MGRGLLASDVSGGGADGPYLVRASSLLCVGKSDLAGFDVRAADCGGAWRVKPFAY